MPDLKRLLAFATLACLDHPLAAGSMPVVSGPTDERMLKTIKAIAASGAQVVEIESRGGRERTALDIADVVARRGMTLVVRKACTSACAQYLVPAARRVLLGPAALIAVHVNSRGLIGSVGSETAEVRSNAMRAESLYKARGVSIRFLEDAASMVRPICRTSVGGSVRIFTQYDAWVPSDDALRDYGLKIVRAAGSRNVPRREAAGYFYRDDARLTFAEPSASPPRKLSIC